MARYKIPACAADTVRINARRFEQSPYFDCYVNSETVFGVAAGRYYDAFHGEDPVETYWNLRRKAVLYDVPEPGILALFGLGLLGLGLARRKRPT